MDYLRQAVLLLLVLPVLVMPFIRAGFLKLQAAVGSNFSTVAWGPCCPIVGVVACDAVEGHCHSPTRWESCHATSIGTPFS
jgi:hypothetical protein